MRLAALGIVALVPMMLGTSPALAHGGRDLISPLCGGGVAVIHLGGGAPAPTQQCPIKGCHAGTTRRYFDAAP